MACGKGSLLAIGTLLLACSWLEWAESRMVPSLEVGRKLRESRAAGRVAAKPGGKVYRPPKAWEMGLGFYKEGDIMERAPRQRNGVATSVFPNARWPNAVIPYVITGTFTAAEQSTIQQGMAHIAAVTCVRFVARSSEAIYLTIGNGDSGCWSYVGRSTRNSENQVNLQSPECVDIGTVVHELMHATGFYHEFTRPDRDEYVSIDRTALAPEYQSDTFFQDNYAKKAPYEVVLFGRPYDYGSVMHYSKYAAAASRAKAVMNNLKPWTGDFGNDNGLSPSDIIDINYMYCNGTTTSTANPTTTSTAKPTTTTTSTAKPKTTTTSTTKPKTTTTSTTTTTTTTKPVTTTTRAPVTSTTVRTLPTLFPDRTGIFTTLIQAPLIRFLELLRSFPLLNLFNFG
ncbi:hatching enzyme 1.2-like [Anopheles moucheti]|uniref:hatching enzyme 1.2-like n=1 Tax=Anopheles moucheti TaxID=186751 RepID=UPI0022EFEEDA|nr:hatching enzyme 1.2-like [Anopheles moucheti]